MKVQNEITEISRMRSIRDRISSEIMNMSLEEQKEYVRRQLEERKAERALTKKQKN